MQTNEPEQAPAYDDQDDYDQEEQAAPEQQKPQISVGNWKDFLLKQELMRAIEEAAFQNPSQVQNQCLGKALTGTDILCQAKAGTGKTAVFVLAILNQLDKDPEPFQALVLCNVRELAKQICLEFQRLGKFLPYKYKCFQGGLPIDEQIKELKNNKPTVVVGCPGRILELVRKKHLDISKLKYFVLDECDTSLQNMRMRTDIQSLFTKTPLEKQVMMFSGTMADDMKDVCRQFMKDQIEVFVEDNSNLVLHGLKQYKLTLTEGKKFSQLLRLLSQGFNYNQVIIFCNQKERAEVLSKKLEQKGYPNIYMSRDLKQNDRNANFKIFKENFKRIMVATDIMGRGIDISRVNMVINFDMPLTKQDYLHRIARAGRFETEGYTVTFLDKEKESESTTLKEIQDDCKYEISELPTEISTV